MQSFWKNEHGVIDAGTGIAIGMLIAALAVIAYIVYTIYAQILNNTTLTGADFTRLNNTLQNITGLLDTSVGLLILVVVVVLLSLALIALIAIKKRAD